MQSPICDPSECSRIGIVSAFGEATPVRLFRTVRRIRTRVSTGTDTVGADPVAVGVVRAVVIVVAVVTIGSCRRGGTHGGGTIAPHPGR